MWIPEPIQDGGYQKLMEDFMQKIFELAPKPPFNFTIHGILLFGSVARGDNFDYSLHESDLDILIVADGLSSDPFDRRMSCAWIKDFCTEIEDIWVTPSELDALIKGRTGWVMDALYDGKILWEHEYFLTSRIAAFKSLIGKELIRVGRTWHFL
ncbi:MAG: nucleotidyltransferase domain-containing protein [Promethearchaeota archaeon]